MINATYARWGRLGCVLLVASMLLAPQMFRPAEAGIDTAREDRVGLLEVRIATQEGREIEPKMGAIMTDFLRQELERAFFEAARVETWIGFLPPDILPIASFGEPLPPREGLESLLEDLRSEGFQVLVVPDLESSGRGMLLTARIVDLKHGLEGYGNAARETLPLPEDASYYELSELLKPLTARVARRILDGRTLARTGTRTAAADSKSTPRSVFAWCIRSSPTRDRDASRATRRIALELSYYLHQSFGKRFPETDFTALGPKEYYQECSADGRPVEKLGQTADVILFGDVGQASRETISIALYAYRERQGFTAPVLSEELFIPVTDQELRRFTDAVAEALMTRTAE